MNKGKHSRKDTRSREGIAGTSSGSAKASKSRSPDTDDSNNDSDVPVVKAVVDVNLTFFNSVIERRAEEHLTVEDLDRLQPELEALLSDTALGIKALHLELASLNTEEGRSDRKAPATSQPSKKRKLSDGKSKASKNKGTPKPEEGSSENETDNSTDLLLNNRLCETAKVPSAEDAFSNKFWASVDPYCGPVTAEAIKNLRDMISSCEIDAQGIKIPPLGEHYSLKWAKEELTEEKEASSADKKRRPGVSSEARTFLKNSTTSCKEKVVGPMAQRLVSALFEENSNLPLQEPLLCNKIDEDYFAKLTNFHTSACFEGRVRKELELLGILEANTDETDQILDDLKQCDKELKLVALRNRKYLSDILVKAEEEMARESIREKIKVVDAEILELYELVNITKIKRKKLHTGLKNQAWRAIKERDTLLKHLKAI